MTINQIASWLAKQDIGKSEAHFGDVKQILAKLTDLGHRKPQIYRTLTRNGKRRARRQGCR